MKTIVVPATTEAIAHAAQIIRAGGLVAFPTETVYGLGANALDAAAAARIYEAKQRALNDPLIVHVADIRHSEAQSAEESLPRSMRGLAEGQNDRLDRLASKGIVGELTSQQFKMAASLISNFWPGALTLVLPRGEHMPPNVCAGLDTVAIRMPDHPIAQALIRESGVPIAAPSANRFGHISPTTAQHVLEDLDGRIDMVLDSGPTRIGVESTVLDLTSATPRILRPGGVTREALGNLLSAKLVLPITNRKLPMQSPGMLEKHYAPNAQLIVCQDIEELYERQMSNVRRKLRTGVLITAAQRVTCKDMHPQFVLGDTMSDIARNLYAGLRALDNVGVDVILMTDVPREGLGEAIADRLKRAAASK